MARNDYGVVFNGRRIVHPGAYDAIDATAMTIVSEGSLDIPVVIGEADAGKSGEIMWFTGLDQARSKLQGGDLVTALDLMFSPSPEGGGGASIVGVMVANETTPSTLSAGGVTFNSISYGEGANRIAVKNEDGSISGTRKLTVSRWDTEQLEVFDNLGAVIKLQYIGSDAVAFLSVTASNGMATKLEVSTGPDVNDATVDLSIDLQDSKFATIRDVVTYINGIPGYSVSYVGYNSNDLSSTLLDAISSLDVKSIPQYIMSLKGDYEHQVNTVSALVTVSIAGTATNFAETYLTGGSKGTTPASWATHLDTLKKEFSDVLVVLSGDPSIHAEALAHVQQMELRNQKQMLFTGGALNETTEQVKRRALGLNSSRAVLAYPGIQYKGSSSTSQLLAPYFTGAMIAGRVVGVSPSEPITFDYFNLVGLERELLAGDPEIDDLITSGICTLEKVQGRGIRLVQGITTYLGANNTLYREISVRRGADNLSTHMRDVMEATFVGKKGVPATIASVTTKAIDVLEEAKRNGDIVGYINIVVSFVGTVVTVSYQVAPIEPINFVLVTSHFVPESLVA